jgi:formylglycine-generating enzyme required for sulfatase activity/predicted Ser/Thr protein kinase
MQRLGKYEVIEEIGRGGFAVVYKARDTTLDRIVALKVLAPHLTWDPRFVARFQNEARSVARLRHPHIVTVYEAGEQDGQLYIAMEYLGGRTLAQVIEEEGSLLPERALSILRQVAEALDYAHRQGVMHRDVKPANVMVEEDDLDGMRATLMDFGLVKAMEGSQSLTSQGTILGSPEYMAPEQADSSREDEIGPATDRYALGVVAYHMLTGQVPFSGPTTAVLHAHAYELPPQPRSIQKDLPAGVARVLIKALSKSSRGRYATSTAMVDALRQAGGKASRPGAAPRQPWSPAWKWVLAGVLAVGLLVGGVWIGSRISLRAASPPQPGATRVWETDGAVMVYVPAGTFWMGSSEDEPGNVDARPQHEVYLDAFWIDRTEVTNAQFTAFLNAQGNQTESGMTWLNVRAEHYLIEEVDGQYQPKSGYEQHPAIEVTWYGANAYCVWAGKRLPTEAEWEKAARGTDERIYPWGDEFDGTRVNFCDANCDPDGENADWDDGYADTAPVGSYPAGASPYGALDMAGNVWEWVADWYGEDYYAGSPDGNPAGPETGEYRVSRGGSWSYSPIGVRAADRTRDPPGGSYGDNGFRCALSTSGAGS